MEAQSELQGSPVARPLVIRFGALGDMVLLTVLIRTLSRRFDSPVDLVASGSWTRPLLQSHPNIGNIYTVRSRRMPHWASRDQQRLVADLRLRGPGPTWYCDTDDVGRRLLRRAAIPDQLIVEARLSPVQASEHFADYWQRIAQLTPTGIAPPPAVAPAEVTDSLPTLVVPQDELPALSRWLEGKSIAGRELILIQVGNKRTMRAYLSPDRTSNTKFWPVESWVAVLRGLRQRHPRAAILMLGVDAERELNSEICNRADIDSLLNVAGEVPIPRLLALASSAIGMVSVDTGPAHCAAAAGGRLVVLFGRAHPVNYAPRGVGARVRCLVGSHNGAASIRGIAPDAVLQAWNEIVGVRTAESASDARALVNYVLA